MRNKKFVLLGLAIFLMLCLLASPMPMGEMGHFQTSINDMKMEGKSIPSATDYVGYVDYDVGAAVVSGTIALGRSYVIARTLFLQQIYTTAIEDDPENYAFSIYWQDTSTLAFKRDTAASVIKIRIHLMEFSSTSGVTVAEYGEYDTIGAKTITEVVMADTFVVLSGWTTAGTSAEQMDFARVTLTSTTQVTIDDCEYEASADRINDVYFQVVECGDFFVQRGTNSDTDNSMTVDIGTPITIADTVLLTQTYNDDLPTYYQIGGMSNTRANWVDTDTFQVDKYEVAGYDWFEDWQVIEWEGWSVQYVDLLRTETIDDVIITEVTVARSVPLLCGSVGAFAWTGQDNVGTANDDINDQALLTHFVNSTAVRTTVGLGYEDGDVVAMVIEFQVLNSAPVNDQTPVCTNLDDTDNLYARYRLYEFSCSVTDAQGYADINYVELRSYDYGTTTLRWAVRYDEDTNAFTEQSGATYIGLTGSTYSKSGVNLDITFKLYIEWAHPDVNDDDLYQYVCDDEPTSDADSYNSNYDYDTDLTTTFTLSDGSGTADRGNFNSIDTITASGTASYENSGGNNYPVTAQVDIFIRCSDVAGSDWSDTTLSSGAWSMTVDSDDVVGIDTYYVKAVQAGGNYDSATLLGATTSDTYIADRVQVQSYSVSDARANINANVNIDVTLDYDYLNQDVLDGTVTINGYTAAHQGSGVWRITRTSASVTSVTYNNVQVTGNTHGITTEDQNSQSTAVIWDRIRVVSYTIVTPSGDNRNNIGTTYTIDVELHYDYNEADLTDGTVTINGLTGTYQSAGKWRFTKSESTVMATTYNNVQATGNTYGITVEDNTVTQLIIWDRIQVQSYSVSDARDDVFDDVNIDATLWYDYDNSQVTDGTVTINGYSAAHQGSGVWRITRSSSTITSVTYNNVQATGNTHGITTEDQNGQSQQVIWDRVRVVSYTIVSPAGDNRNNIGTTYTIDIELHYDYDETDVTDGTITVNGHSATYQSAGKWRFTDYEAGVASITYNLMVTTGNIHGITEELNTVTQQVIWDRVQVQSYTVTDDWVNINDNVNIDFLVWYDYDNTQVTDGDFTLNGHDATHQGSGVWRITRTSASPALVTYNIVLVSAANTHGIDVEDQNGKSRQVVWDSVTIAITGPTDNRQNLNANATGIVITITMDYNATTYGGTATMNNTDYNGDGTVVRWGYTVSSVNGGTEGITTISSNDETYMIWDSLTVTITGPTDNRQNLNANASGIIVSAIRDYDSSVFDGTLTLNNTDYNGDGTVVRWDYTVDSASGGTYGITTISSNDDTYMIWDEIEVYWSLEYDSRCNIGDNNWGGFRLRLKYDNHLLNDGTNDDVQVNSSVAVWSAGGLYWYDSYSYDYVSAWNFVVTSASEDTYGITALDAASASTYDADLIWDAIGINMWMSDGRDDIDDTITVYAWLSYMYDMTNVTDGTVLLNGTGMSYGSNIWSLGRTQSTVGLWAYNITSISGNTHGITAIGSIYSVQSYPSDITVSGGLGGLGNSTGGTFSFWLYVDWDSVGYADCLMAQGSDWDHGILIIATANSILELDLRYTDGTDDRYNMRVNLSSYSNTWVHVSYVFDGDAQLIYAYVNGVAAAEIYGSYSEAASKPILPDVEGDDFALFECPWAANPFYDGQVNAVRIYNRSLSAVEIFELYQGRYSNDTGLLLHYSANSIDVADNIWYDLSDEGNNGTLYVITVNITVGELYVRPIWDEIEVYWNSVSDSRTNINEQEWPLFKLRSKYDSHEVNISGSDTVYINSSLATWSAGSLAWYKLYTQTTVGTWNFLVTSVSEDTYGITALDSVSAVTYDKDIIWDRMQVQTTATTDNYIEINTESTTINVTVFLDYDDAVIGGGNGTVTLNNTAMTWDTDHWYLVFGPYNVFDEWTLYVNGSTDATYSITAFDLNGQSDTVGTDRIIVVSSYANDTRVNVDDYVMVYAQLAYESNYTTYNPDGLTLVDGTYTGGSYTDLVAVDGNTYNFSEATGSPAFDIQGNFSCGAFQGISIYFYSSSAHGVHEIHLYMWNYTSSSWDFIVEIPHSVGWHWVNVTVNSADGYGSGGQAIARFYHAGAGNPTMDFRIDYAALQNSLSYLQSGNVWIESYAATHLGDGIWNITVTHDVVAQLCFNNVTVSGNNRGITTVTNQTCQYVVWDSLTITITIGDNRIDINENVTITVTSVYDYDAFSSNCSYTMNDTTYDYGTVGIYYYTVSSVSGDVLGITLIGTNDVEYVIFDRIKILTTTTDDGRIDYDTQAIITATAELEYDSHALGTGDTIYMNGTSMSWNGSHFILNPQFAESEQWNFFVNSTSANEATYGITVVSLDGNNVNQIWDRVSFTWNANMTWTITTYYINVSFTAIHEYDSAAFVGNLTAANCTITNSTTAYEILTEVFGNHTYYTITTLDDIYGISVFTTNTVWCVFDNITASESHGVTVTDYSKTFFIFFGELQWQYNGSNIGIDWICLNMRNDTQTTTAITLVDSILSPIKQTIYIPVGWDGVLYSNNATKTVGGRVYNFQWYSISQTIVATQDIREENTEILVTTITVSGTTNVDFTWTIYNENVISVGETGTVSDTNNWEVVFNLVLTYGIHNYSIYFDAGVSGDRWLNNSYFIDFDVNIDPPEARDVNIEVRGTINLECSYYVYHEGVYSEQTGSLAPTTFSFFFTKETAVGLHNYSLYFNVSASVSKWKNGSYMISTDYSYCSVVLYGPEGTGLNPLLFKVLINGTEHTSSAVTFYGGINLVHNVTVLNYFDEVVGTDINQMPADKIIRILINVYTFKIYNQMDDEFIYFNMTSSGGAEWSEHIGPREVVKFILYSGNTYSYKFTAISGPSGGTHTGSVTVSADTGMIIDGYDLVEIYEGISRASGGGNVPVEDLYIALTVAQGGILTQVQFYTWLSVILLFVGLYAIPFVKNKGRMKPVETEIVIEETFGGYKKKEVPKKKIKHEGQFKKGDKRIKPKKKKPAYERMQDNMEKKIKEQKEKEDAIWRSIKGYEGDDDI